MGWRVVQLLSHHIWQQKCIVNLVILTTYSVINQSSFLPLLRSDPAHTAVVSHLTIAVAAQSKSKESKENEMMVDPCRDASVIAS